LQDGRFFPGIYILVVFFSGFSQLFYSRNVLFKQVWILDRLFALPDMSFLSCLFLWCCTVVVILAGTAALIDRITPDEGPPSKQHSEHHTAEAKVSQKKAPQKQATRNQAQDNKASDEMASQDFTTVEQLPEESASQDFATVEQLPDGEGYDQTLESPGYVRLFAEHGLNHFCEPSSDDICRECGYEDSYYNPCYCGHGYF
jgi:hypothetical protein